MVYSSHPTNTKTVNPSLKSCLSCEDELKFRYRFSNNTIWTLEGPVVLNRNTHACMNKVCEEFKKPVTAPDESPKHHTIGYDVLLLIGLLKINLGMTAKKIQTKLWVEYKLSISEQHIGNLVNKYLMLLGNKPQKKFLQMLKDRGKVVLDIDGIKPEKGNKILYLIRDCRSGVVLLARTLKYNSTDQLELLLEEIELMQLDIIGIVSDKQRSIVNAVENIYPDLPHQFCQFHYLKNISKDYKESDLSLRKKLRKGVRPILRTSKTVKRQFNAGKRTLEELEILGRLYDGLKHVLKWTPKYPFKTVGIELYEDIKSFEKTVKAMSKAKHVNVFKTMLRHCKFIKTAYKSTYERLIEQRYDLHRINDILQSGDTHYTSLKQRKKEKESKEGELLNYVENRLRSSRRQKASEVLKGLRDWYTDVAKITKSWLPGLFNYCLEPLLEKTNNLLEQSIKDLKQSLKHLLNSKLIHRYLLRRGEFLIFGLQNGELLTEDELMVILKQNGGTVDTKMQERFEDLSDYFKVDRRCREDFEGELKQISKEWRSIA